MAWFAELKRRHWYCINGVDIIRWYKKFLYDNWWNSLSEEDKIKIEEKHKKESEEADRQLRNSLVRLGMITAAVAGLGTPYCNKYNGVYDKFGFPI